MNIYHVYEDLENADINLSGGICQKFVRNLQEAKQFIKENEEGKVRLHAGDVETGRWIYKGKRTPYDERVVFPEPGEPDPEKPTPQPVTWYIQRMELMLDKSNICMALNYWPRDAENFYIK